MPFVLRPQIDQMQKEIEASVLMQRLSYQTENVLSNKSTRNRIVLSYKDSPRKPLGRRPREAAAAHRATEFKPGGKKSGRGLIADQKVHQSQREKQSGRSGAHLTPLIYGKEGAVR